jgi:phage N-6-adenine-methyltransferase
VGECGSGRFQVVPPLSDEEFAALKTDIERRGVLVPVEYDEEGSVLDGHHRIRACRELGITTWDKIVRRDLGDDRAKREHARALNLARRHLSAEAKRRIIAEQLLDTPERADQWIAEDLGVSKATVSDVREELVTKCQIDASQPRIDRNGVARVAPARRKYEFIGAHDHRLVVTKYTGEVEWHTPAQWVEAARRVLGAIDLDPASSDRAQETVAAKRHFTKEMDGLARPWAGRVWLNPPYAAGLVDRFVGKLVEHVRAGDVAAAVLLTDNRTETEWFHRAAGACQRICLKRGRISFVRPDGAGADASTSGSVFFYFGGHPDVFDDVFGPFGLLVRRA